MTTATKTNALASIATSMRSSVISSQRGAHHRLPRGLEIVMQRHVESSGAMRWRLALGRQDVAPSDEEIAICRNAFGVPEGTEHTAAQTKNRPSKKTGKLITWHIVEMYWYEA